MVDTRKKNKDTLFIGQEYSLHAEQAVIGAIIFNPEETYTLLGDRLTSDKFHDPFCRSVYQKSIDFLSSGNVADVIVLSVSLESVISLSQEEIQAKLTEICLAFPGCSNIEAWAEVICEKAANRGLKETGQRLIDLAHAQEISSEVKVTEANRMLSGVASSMAKNTVVNAASMLAQTVAMIEQNSLNGSGVTGLSTGFTELDELTAGLQGGDLIICAGRPAMGKTSFALTLGHAIAAGPNVELRRGVALFSLEMGTTQIGMRWIAVDKDIALGNMRTGRVTPDEWVRLQEVVTEADDVKFYIEENANITLNQISATARQIKKEKGLSLLIIDYLQLIAGSEKSGSNRGEQISEISRGLKQLARELEIPVIALSQLSRKLEERADRRPIMSDLRESGAIEQDADIIIFIYRDEVYNPNTVDKGIAEVIIAKQRNGALGTVRLGFDGPTTRFYQGSLKRKKDTSSYSAGYREVSVSSI
jgi:replicative DNA helicase